MALDLEELNAQLDRLRTARASGVLRVVVDGLETTFKSDTDMAAAEAALTQRIAALTGAAVTEIRIFASKGLDA